MAKTFDNISEASTINYLFLFAQKTITLRQEPPTPPPLNALSLPYELVCLVLWLKKKLRPSPPQGKLEASSKDDARGEVPPSPPPTPPDTSPPSLEHAQPEEGAKSAQIELTESPVAEAPVVVEKSESASRRGSKRGSMWGSRRPSATAEVSKEEADKTQSGPAKPKDDPCQALAQKISDYIQDHQADVAQEERWRTTMQRKMDQHFRALDAKVERLLRVMQAPGHAEEAQQLPETTQAAQ